MFLLQTWFCFDADPFLLLCSNAGRAMSSLEVDVLDELGSGFEVPPWIPTSCPGSQPQMATGVFFRVWQPYLICQEIL